ncbi:hypothetical protein ACFPER_15155 [Agromyces aurantiacus]|uniref:Histidine kinase n=1 Tax=Agromyces aurantiacus TaxID=165814 RepID=A0ABV9R7N4_9MICO|nr:hypothetical protein [Agromyces aurantiacus]MBM7504966.1 hypothetical protein [Agromyces aurantiacus]
MTSGRSERTRVIADLAWLGGVIQVAFGAALLATSEAPVVAATLAIIGGSATVLAGTLVFVRARASWTTAMLAFALSLGAAAYAAWVAAPYWRGALVAGVLALGGLLAEWTDRLPASAGPRSGGRR